MGHPSINTCPAMTCLVYVHGFGRDAANTTFISCEHSTFYLAAALQRPRGA
uniref:Uncharacterized protein n=1 Tax=Anguilla anguilla TaxID=7936 RepID=A0A0E9R0W5_ANGAN